MRRLLNHLKEKAMGREMAQWLGANTALAEDLDSAQTPTVYSHL